MKNKLTVIVLSGGQSTRFRPLPHKMMMPLLGKTFLDHQIETLLRLQFKKIVVIATDEIAQRLSNEHIKIVVQKGEGQSAALLSAKEYLSNEPVLVINGDDLVADHLYNLLLKMMTPHKHLMVGLKAHRYFPGGYLVLEGKRIARVHEKPGAGNEPSDFVRLVFDYFTHGSILRSYLEKNPLGAAGSQYEEVLSDMMSSGEEFEMIEYDGVWIPVKYPWHFLGLMEEMLRKIHTSVIHPSVSVHETATISGPVILEANVRVMEYAKLVGPLYVGAGTIIGNHTLVRTSHIGENSVIGFSSDVTRSYIGNNSWFHSNYVGDSIVADDVGMGAGATLANLRLDEGEVYSMVKGQRIPTERNKLGAIIGNGVRVGVGTYLMPGVKVGQNSVVGAGCVLQSDLAENKLCFSKQTHQITENVMSNARNRDRFRQKI